MLHTLNLARGQTRDNGEQHVAAIAAAVAVHYGAWGRLGINADAAIVVVIVVIIAVIIIIIIIVIVIVNIIIIIIIIVIISSLFFSGRHLDTHRKFLTRSLPCTIGWRIA